MATNSKEIRRRIKSTQSIAKITKAMELVSAAKMRKAQMAAQASRPYATISAELLTSLANRSGQLEHPLLKQAITTGVSKKALCIAITSDKGLAGSLNSNVVNKIVTILKEDGRESIDFVTVGRKGLDAIRRLGGNIIATFPGKDRNISQRDAQPIAEIAMNDFTSGKYGKVFIAYPQFISTLVQKPNILQLLPFVQEDREEEVGDADDLLFEPNPNDVLENVIVRAVEFAVFQTMAESAASEHSARMVAMRNANEAAGDLIDDLSLTYNQARQAGITRELSEISAAKLAMEG
jgi:F-type H+-transporting ATPase subunit gamma